jgi:hypothetical protein
MNRAFTFAVILTVGLLGRAAADEVKVKKESTNPCPPEKVAPSFSRWIERQPSLTSTKTSPSWISGEIGVRVLAIRK